MTGLAVVVYALAVMRVTMLITRDTITEPLRDTVADWLTRGRDTDLWADFVECPWCVSMWVAAVAVPLVYWWGDSLWLYLPAMVLAASQLTGMASGLGRSRCG